MMIKPDFFKGGPIEVSLPASRYVKSTISGLEMSFSRWPMRVARNGFLMLSDKALGDGYIDNWLRQMRFNLQPLNALSWAYVNSREFDGGTRGASLDQRVENLARRLTGEVPTKLSDFPWLMLAPGLSLTAEQFLVCSSYMSRYFGAASAPSEVECDGSLRLWPWLTSHVEPPPTLPSPFEVEYGHVGGHSSSLPFPFFQPVEKVGKAALSRPLPVQDDLLDAVMSMPDRTLYLLPQGSLHKIVERFCEDRGLTIFCCTPAIFANDGYWFKGRRLAGMVRHPDVALDEKQQAIWDRWAAYYQCDKDPSHDPARG